MLFRSFGIVDSRGDIKATTAIKTQSVTLTPEDIGTWKIIGEAITITTNKIPEGETWYIRSIQTINRITLESYPLENLDTIRDKILLTAGDVVFDISDTAKSVAPFTNFVKRKAVNNKLNATDPQYGLCLKTYNSDLYQNWINTEWIEGVNNKNNNKQNPSGGNMVYSKYTNNKQNNARKLSTRKPRHNQG